MYLDKSIAVVVPARNEARQIETVLVTMPALVDAVLVVDDASDDATPRIVTRLAADDPRIRLIRLHARQGVGRAIAVGYQEALAAGYDIAVVMAGDGQMDPADLLSLVAPIALDHADYVKGNRFAYPGGAKMIPRLRRLGNVALSLLTKAASGYPHIFDSQCGYTAIHRSALGHLDLDALYPSYGYPNDLLGRLNQAEQRVAEVPVAPRYGIGERSQMRISRVILPIGSLLLRMYVRRIRRARARAW